MLHRVYLTLVCLFVLFNSCDKRDDNLVYPMSSSEFPQVMKFDDEEDGDLEDEDKFSFKLTLNDRVDPEGIELGGKIIPLNGDAIVHFEVKEFQGFSNLQDYIKGAEAYYEIDDCTTSADQGIDLNLRFDPATGKGSVRFPKDVEEIEIEFETDPDLFDDDIVNDDERSITIAITLIEANDDNITFNPSLDFKYTVLDDETAYGDWELDPSDPVQFRKFKQLFGIINGDIRDLDADDVDKIEITIEFNEVKVVVELKETEEVEDCGSLEIVNKVIEIKADLEEIGEGLAGDIEFVGDLEQDNGAEKEFVYKGAYVIVNGKMILTLQGEYDDEETEEVVLELEK